MQQPTLWTGAALGLAVGALAWRFRALSVSGALAAASMGAVAVAAGWSWAIILLAYFVASTALSRFRSGEKERRTSDRLEKGGRRDAIQVFANGGVFAMAAIGYYWNADPAWQVLAAGALAASAADTWATEIGTLAGRQPRSIVTGRIVSTGTSGGVSLPGLVATLAGAAFVGMVAFMSGWPRPVTIAAFIGGAAGSIIDSVLGATLQSRRFCHECHADTERKVHGCGTRTTVVGGLRWLDNDGVNALSTVGGALVALLCWRWL